MKRILLGLFCLAQILSARASELLTFADFSAFKFDGATLVSPILSPIGPWNELIVSWNLKGEGKITLETRVLFPDNGESTPYYKLADWSAGERRSGPRISDAFATVALDTLILKKNGGQIQTRITFSNAAPADLKFLAFSFTNTKSRPLARPANTNAWRKTLDVPVRSQIDYRNGLNWCSPTGVSMVLEYWSRKLSRPELAVPVPEMAERVVDPAWNTVGHWSFNTAAAGNFTGMRAYVTRFEDVADLEAQILAGNPVAVSLSQTILKGEKKPPKSHLVVVTGFNKRGDVIVNDPGFQRDRVRRTLPRARFRAAWADSHNTAYVIYPD